jgi:predicted CXXCH cytochrome family protein
MLATGLVALGSMGVTVLGDIQGTPHDFSGFAWSSGEICKPCHTPHFADTTIGYLWAHTLSAEVYTLHDGSISGPGGVNELDQATRLCLSCHDGTVALNDFHGNTEALVYIDPAFRVGGGGDHLLDDHPIGNTAIYPVAGNSELNAAVLSGSGLWGFGGGVYPEVPLFPLGADEVVGCASCHSPHGVTGVDHLLRKDNTGSDLCVTCHIK